MMREDPLIGQTVHGNLVIQSKLGEGGMGRVYLATHATIKEKRYAVKILKRELTYDPGFRQHFYDEARHQAQLDHPNIVQMVDYFQFEHDYFLVQEYVDGKPLSTLIEEAGGKGLPEKQALSIVKGLLAGLDCAHRQAILHRDVKSSNVLVDRSGRARITDFGIAVQSGAAMQHPGGKTMGTPGYMSPEQIRDSTNIDHRADVYSAGAVLFEALTGRLPFDGDTFEAILAQQATREAPDPRSINPKIRKSVAEIVRRALRNDPAQRFQGCAQFLKTLEGVERDITRYIVLLSGCVLIAVCVYLLKAMVFDKRAIESLVVDASHTYNMLCVQNGNRESNANLRASSADKGNSDITDLLSKRIDESERNMQTAASSYARVLNQLSHFNQWTVRRVFEETDPDPLISGVRPQLQEDYRQFVSTGNPPGALAMRRECGKVFDTK
jgi:serine/threonine protein kinase